MPRAAEGHSGRGDGTAARGIALGVLENVELEECEITVDPGDILVLYTDGVTEATDVDRQPFGEDQLRSVVAAKPDAGAEEVVSAVVEAVRAHTGDAPQSDDIALFVIKRTQGVR